MSKKILLITGTIFFLSSLLIVYIELVYPSMNGFSVLKNIGLKILILFAFAIIASIVICSIYGLFFLHKNLFKQKFLRAIPFVFLIFYVVPVLIISKITYDNIKSEAKTSQEKIDEKIKEINPADSSLILGNANDSILAPQIGQLTYLKMLVLSDTKIKKLPAEFSKLQNLTELDLIGNAFEIFPQEIFALKKLEHLNMEGNQIKEIPIDITNLENLKHLSFGSLLFGGNPISFIPPYIGQLKKLEFLSMGFCPQIDSLPMELSNLKNLQTLHLTGAGFERFPIVICELENLEELMISIKSDTFPTIPTCIGRLRKLKTIVIQGCERTEKDKENLQKLLPNTKIIF